MTRDLSVVIPAYNEEVRLRRAIPLIARHLEQAGRSFEIIVVDDGSSDRTAEVTRGLAKTYPMVRLLTLQTNRGKGGAVRPGMLEAIGRYVLFTDADQSTPIHEVDHLLDRLEGGQVDVAIGSRAVAGSRVEEKQVWFRALAGKLFGLGTRVLAIRGIADTQCGFKCMTREAAQKIFTQVTSDSAIFDIEMLVIAAREGFRIAEVPVTWVHDPDTRIPYNVRRSVGIWVELFRIRRAQRVRWPLRARAGGPTRVRATDRPWKTRTESELAIPRADATEASREYR